MNKVILTGRLVKDPELKKTKTEKDVVSNSVAVKRDVKNDKGEYDVDFINFIVFDQGASFLANYAKKGATLELCGRWQTRKYQDKDGKERVANEVLVDNIGILRQAEDKKENYEVVDGDIPF